MPTRFSKGTGLFGALKSSGLLTSSDVVVSEGSLVHAKSNTIARTNTTAKTLFTLPANAVITALRVYGATASDAVTTAVISVGKTAAGFTDYLANYDVKGAAGSTVTSPTTATLGSIGSSAVTVKGIYAETGGASSTGGPWTIIVEYTTS